MEEIVERLAQEHGLPLQKAKEYVYSTFDGLLGTVKGGKPVRIRNFGTFKVKGCAPRTGRNPKTGEVMQIPARNRLTFKGAAALNEFINS